MNIRDYRDLIESKNSNKRLVKQVDLQSQQLINCQSRIKTYQALFFASLIVCTVIMLRSYSNLHDIRREHKQSIINLKQKTNSLKAKENCLRKETNSRGQDICYYQK